MLESGREYWCEFIELGTVCTLPVQLERQYLLGINMDFVEINIDSSNGHNELEPKRLGLGLAHFLNIVISIRNKLDT
jgi:hypothetical protein